MASQPTPSSSSSSSPTGTKKELYKPPVRPGDDMWLVWESKIRTEFPRADKITSTELQKLLYPPPQSDTATTTSDQQFLIAPGTKIILLDVRTPREFAVSRLHPSAVLVPSKHTPDTVKRIVNSVVKSAEEDYSIVCYGSIGYRSCRLTQLLIDSKQFKEFQVFSLKGGIFNWANEGKPLVVPDASGGDFTATNRVHPQNPVFGEMLASNLHKYPDPKSSGCVVG